MFPGRRALIVGALSAMVLGLAACGSTSSSSSSSAAGSSTPAAGGSSADTVDLAKNSSIGQSILVNDSGMTLYYLKGETAGHLICTSQACLKFWPPLYLPSGTQAPTAVSGIAAGKLGTVKRPGGKLQVTFNGLPLYTFAGDTSAGQAKGQDLTDSAGTWFVLGPSGAITAPGASGGSTGSTSSGSSSSSGGGWG
jgi:predicted lipoprotein with Yx(FWY)xxD motif